MPSDISWLYNTILEHASSTDTNFSTEGVSEPFVDYGDLRRFLSRVGVVSRKGSTTAHIQLALDDAAAVTKAPRQTIERVLGLFCSGNGTPEHAICGRDPRCGECPINDRCGFHRRKPGIKQMPAAERPRERLILEGEEALSNAELLGIIIGGGTMEETAVDLGRRMLAHCTTLRALSRMTIKEMSAIRGIGPARAAGIKAAFALARRLMAEGALNFGGQFCSSRAIFEAFHPQMRDLKREVFKVLLLDSKNHLMKAVQISEGSLTSSIVHPREVYAAAIRESASGVIFVHNHPSGDPTPSSEDIRVTKRLRDAGDLVGIRVLDHIVIGEGRYYSFLDEGVL